MLKESHSERQIIRGEAPLLKNYERRRIMEKMTKETQCRVFALLKEDMDVIYAFLETRDDDPDTICDKRDRVYEKMRRLGLAVEYC